jgi:hypothetical protein
MPLSLSDGLKKLHSVMILPTRHSQFKLKKIFDDEPELRSLRSHQSLHQSASGGLTHPSRARPRTRTLIVDQEALRAPDH